MYGNISVTNFALEKPKSRARRGKISVIPTWSRYHILRLFKRMHKQKIVKGFYPSKSEKKKNQALTFPDLRDSRLSYLDL